MGDLDPFRLSREFRVLAERGRALGRDVARGRPTLDPFSGRDWPGKRLFDELSALDASDPLRTPFLRWAYYFIDERVQLPFRVHEGRLRCEVRHGLRQPRDGEFSLAELSRFALTSSDRERRAYLAARAGLERGLGAHRVELWARRAEVGRRLGLAHPDELLGPLETDAATTQLAESFLKETQGLSEHLGIEDYFSFFEARLALPAAEALPARLAPDTILGLLGGAELVRGLRIESFRLPDRLVPSSFALGFAGFGQAWAEALAPREYPFVVTEEPMRLSSRREGLVFAGWWCHRAFLRRRLGVNQETARVQERAWRTAFLLEGRGRAAKVLIRVAALAGRVVLERESARIAVTLFGEELEPEQLLGRLDLAPTAASEFVAFLASVVRDQQLIDEHDEDYFDNPRALGRLKEEAHRVPELRYVSGQLDGAVNELIRGLSEVL